MPNLGSATGDLAQPVWQIKILLINTRPPVWRRVMVPSDFTLAQVHRVVQRAMGWEDYHLHEFRIRGRRYGVPDPEDRLMGGVSPFNEKKVRLSDVAEPGSTAEYIYDFGDGWHHRLKVEKAVLAQPDECYPLCTGGRMRCPPEDSGSVSGFYHKLEVLSDPSHEEYEETRAWMGEFDAGEFSAESVNRKLRKAFRSSGKNRPARAAAPRAPQPSLEDLDRLLEGLEGMLGRQARPVQRIGPNEKVPLELSGDERKLILEHCLAQDDLTQQLRLAPESGQPCVLHHTLEDWDDLAGYVASEANHTKDKNLERKLVGLFSRISDLLESYTDEEE